MRQYTRSADCLSCSDPCCRFHPSNSGYFPLFTDEEVEKVLMRGYPKEFFKRESSNTYRLKLTEREGRYLICPFVVDGKRCSIYDIAPFYCKIWPFSVMKKGGKLVIALDVSEYCPSLIGRFLTEEFQDHVEYLKSYLGRKPVRDFLETYDSLVFEYEDGYAMLTELD